MKEDLASRSRSVTLVTLNISHRCAAFRRMLSHLAPVIADGVGEDRTARMNVALGNREGHSFRLLQLRTSVFVPEGIASVGAHRGKRVMVGMESQVVNLNRGCQEG